MAVLWALRSPCNLGCDYCYFGTLEDDRIAPPQALGVLSHLPHGDLPLAVISDFLTTTEQSRIGRVFLAGGEPLIWPGTGQVIERLAGAGVEVVVCTNGLPLRREPVRRLLLAHAAAVSVSLDSARPDLNDLHRRPRRPGDGWHGVIEGIRALIADRDTQPSPRAAGPRIGLYTVLTRLTLPGLADTVRLAADLGLDYVVPQPISLAPDHRLHGELALRAEDGPAVRDALEAVSEAVPGMLTPGPGYPARVISTLHHDLQTEPRCFGGADLAFIEPDGTVWDCPSRHRIAAAASAGRTATISGTDAATLFPLAPRPERAPCPLFSDDCVNMWPLVEDFDRFLADPAARNR
ncbi:hypothetical protein AFB00_17430 [Pseudonocardia sp. HH130630-07]|nr:hypothetical protein AFB00_17430 [Pseudonocardia sp. HH130630-07]